MEGSANIELTDEEVRGLSVSLYTILVVFVYSALEQHSTGQVGMDTLMRSVRSLKLELTLMLRFM